MTSRFMQGAVLLAAMAAPAWAQTDPMASAREAAANQVGVMEYCQKEGYADADAVTAQRGVYAQLPPAPAGAPSTDAAQALGRTGTLSANGTTTTLASLASSRSTSVSALCGQMVDSARQAASLRRSMGAMPGTAMPGMPTMPGVPTGLPTMPSGGLTGVPGLPGMGTPSK